MSKLIIAEEIKSLLGHKTLYMLGAYDMFGAERSLQFKIKGSKAFRHIEISLNGKDLYDMTFTNWRGSKITNKEVVNDVYLDMVHKIIEEKTGLYTKLF